MTNRREFLQIGVAATAWPIVAGAVQAAGVTAVPDRTVLLAAVYDPRLPDGIAFAERSRALGLRTLAIDSRGDMTRLWYEEIHPRWQQTPVALAGFTSHGPMFCFAELARDVRMRMVFQAEHRTNGSDGALHRLRGPVAMLGRAADACSRPGVLGAAMADIVARCPAGRHEIASAERTGATRAATLPGEEAAYTWVVAPAIKA